MKNIKVLVAGCGGLGCYCVEYLARLGIGKILVADGDVFSEGNLNRQLYCTESTLGVEKVLVASERWPDQVISYSGYIDQKNAKKLCNGCDIVIDALDNVDSRKVLADACEALSIPMIHGAIGDTNCQVCVIYPGDKDILDIIYPHGIANKVPTVSFTPAFCASMQISLAYRILQHDYPERRILYISDLGTMDFETVKI